VNVHDSFYAMLILPEFCFVLYRPCSVSNPIKCFVFVNTNLFSDGVGSSGYTCSKIGWLKEKLPLSMSRRHIGWVEVLFYLFLTSALDGGKWSASCSGRFISGKNSGTCWIGDWVGPRAGLDVLEKRKISFLYRDSNPDRPAHTIVTVPTELPWLPC
jgi:hypothetical protein